MALSFDGTRRCFICNHNRYVSNNYSFIVLQQVTLLCPCSAAVAAFTAKRNLYPFYKEHGGLSNIIADKHQLLGNGDVYMGASVISLSLNKLFVRHHISNSL